MPLLQTVVVALDDEPLLPEVVVPDDAPPDVVWLVHRLSVQKVDWPFTTLELRVSVLEVPVVAAAAVLQAARLSSVFAPPGAWFKVPP